MGGDLPPLQLRLAIATWVDAAHIALVEATLSAASLAIVGDAELARGVAALLLFKQVDADTLRRVRELSRLGRERVLTLASPGTRLTQDDTWLLIDAGASDAFAWADCTHPGSAIAARIEHWARIDRLVDAPIVRDNLIGTSAQWLALRRKAVEAAIFMDAPVLILGETGTGKELVARLVHSLDPERSTRDLVIIDCTTLTPELCGSELFGHERGAFTGAVGPRDGAFALADGGTLFLDEVGELPLALQAQMLRTIQEGTYKRVGGNEWRRVDFRLLCATNRDLARDVAEGRFRRDLYYRIAGCIVRTPALCGRREDILPLARHFLREHLGATATIEISPAVSAYLLDRDYPGNVRDLSQLVVRIAQRYSGHGPVTLGDIPDEDRPPSSGRAQVTTIGLEACVAQSLSAGKGLREIRQLVEDLVFHAAIESSATLREAAAKLGISERALQMRRAATREAHSFAAAAAAVDGPTLS